MNKRKKREKIAQIQFAKAQNVRKCRRKMKKIELLIVLRVTGQTDLNSIYQLNGFEKK